MPFQPVRSWLHPQAGSDAGYVLDVARAPTRTRVAARTGDGAVLVFAADSLAPLATVAPQDPDAATAPLSEVHFANDGSDALVWWSARSGRVGLSDLRAGGRTVLSMDGGSSSSSSLINLFDITTLDEDTSLYQIIKADSVNRLGFFGPSMEYIHCTTHIESMMLYQFQNADLVRDYGGVRDAVAGLQMDYIIDLHYEDDEKRLYLFCGTDRYAGCSYHA
ncbi:WD repeat-containing protein 89 [Cladochytrium tenue]|nr:WD repeat-containing protein 89 [Cladochytrium tenue]